MNQNYWTNQDQELIEKWYWCYTASTSAQTRNYCIARLQPAFTRVSRAACNSVGVKQDPDIIQDCVINISIKLINRLQPDRFADGLQAAFQFLWVSTRRYLITYYKQKKQLRFEGIEDYDRYDNLPTETDILELRQEIMQALDEKIEEQQQLNKSQTIFLILMKTYILENNYDVRGFDTWVMQKMNINRNTYRSLISRVNIRSKIFNEKLPE